MRIIMVGTGPFAVPTFRGLIGSRHEVVMLVCSPLRFCRGRRPDADCPMRRLATERGIPLFDPEDINTAESIDRLARAEADVLVVCDYGQILSRDALAAARLGGINLHGSLLPKYRGAAPINWAVYHGEAETGVTVIHMTPAVDAGPCIAQASTPIGPDETAVELEARLCQLGDPLIRQVLDHLEEGHVEAITQDPTLASRAPRLKKTDGQIDWSRTAADVKNHIRAMVPWPASYTFWHRAGCPPMRLILGPVSVEPGPDEAVPPGTVLCATGGLLVIAAGRGSIVVSSVQPAGKRMLSADEFLRGYPVQVGDQWGPE